mgnify:CR=1 FL=1|tara:strand:+ start:4804 stop:5529 length:726 start_codon:yes stop_codon:yes gene_type:complete
MLRLMALTIPMSAGLAAAGTVQFAPSGGSLSGVRTFADLSADASTFTITFRNETGSGAMTAFYIEAGSAVSGLGSGAIDNGTGVLFAPFAQNGRDGNANSGTRPAGSAGGVAGTSGYTPIGGPLPNGGSGMADVMGNWSGTFFGMTRVGPGGLANGQATGELVSLTFSHDGSFSLSNLMRALAADEIRFIQRYQNYGSEGQSGYLGSNIASVVPLPPAAWAGLGTLAALAGFRGVARRIRR